MMRFARSAHRDRIERRVESDREQRATGARNASLIKAGEHVRSSAQPRRRGPSSNDLSECRHGQAIRYVPESAEGLAPSRARMAGSSSGRARAPEGGGVPCYGVGRAIVMSGDDHRSKCAGFLGSPSSGWIKCSRSATLSSRQDRESRDAKVLARARPPSMQRELWQPRPCDSGATMPQAPDARDRLTAGQRPVARRC
jgi:hypothetical protein